MQLSTELRRTVRNAVKRVALTPRQRTQWEECRAALLYQCPAFTNLFYTMLVPSGEEKNLAVFTPEFPVAATDGTSLLLNPDVFFDDKRFSLPNRVFILAHEVMHNVFNHVGVQFVCIQAGNIMRYADGTALPFIPELFNVAADYVINAILVEGKIGQMPAKEGLYDPKIATGTDSAHEVYRRLYKQAEKEGRIVKVGVGKGGGPGVKGLKDGFDVLADPGQGQGKDPYQANGERNEGEWKLAVKSAMESARMQGKLPMNLQRMFEEVIETQVPWEELVEAFFARKVGNGSYDWRRPNRQLIVRDIYIPGKSGHSCGTIVAGGDTSGSIGPKTLNMFFGALCEILELLRPKRLVLLWCDAKLQRADELTEVSDLNVIREKGAPGGGGTSFVPVFDYVDEHHLEPDALIYLTDGYGTFPDAKPAYPVLWGDITGQKTQYPWGDIVHIPPQAE